MRRRPKPGRHLSPAAGLAAVSRSTALGFAALCSAALGLPGLGRADPVNAAWVVTTPSNYGPAPVRPGAEVRAGAANRWVVLDLGDGQEVAFDAWAFPEKAQPISHRNNVVVLNEMKASTWFRAQLDEAELELLDAVQVRTPEDTHLGAWAFYEGETPVIAVTNGFAFHASGSAALLARYGPDEAAFARALALNLASEYEFSQGRERWFWQPVFDWIEAGLKPIPPADPVIEDVAMRDMTRLILLHELCHHFKGHALPSNAMVMAQLKVSDPAAFQRRSWAEESEAEACAGGYVAAAGGDPRVSLAFMLAVSMFVHPNGEAAHPGGAERVKALKALGDKVAERLLADGEDPAMVARMQKGFADLSAQSVDPARLEAALARLRRGAWPACPLTPEAVCQ